MGRPVTPERTLNTRRRSAIMAFFGGISGGVVFPTLPALGARLGLSALVVGVVLSATGVTRVCFSPIVGWLSDRFGAT